MKRYAYGWITAPIFLVSITGHWTSGHARPHAHGYPDRKGDPGHE